MKEKISCPTANKQQFPCPVISTINPLSGCFLVKKNACLHSLIFCRSIKNNHAFKKYLKTAACSAGDRAFLQ